MAEIRVECGQYLDNQIGPVVDSCLRHFDLTILFEESFLSILPSAISLLIVPLRIFWLSGQKIRCRQGWLLTVKMTFWATLTLLELVLLVLWSTVGRASQTSTGIPAAVLAFISVLPLGALSFMEDGRTIKPSMTLETYLLITSACDTVRTRTIWLQAESMGLKVLFSIALAVRVILLLLEAQHRRDFISKSDEARSPEDFSGIIGKSFSWWLVKLFITGYRKEITQVDLYPIPANMDSVTLYRHFLENDSKRGQVSTDNQISKGSLKKSNFTHLLWRAVAWPIFKPVIPKALNVTLTLAQPLLMIKVIDFLESPATENSNYLAVGLIIAYATVYIGLALTNAWAQQQIYRGVCHMRGILVALIYQHTLELDPKSGEDSPAITLMSIDVQRIADGAKDIHQAWSAPIQAAIASWLLQRQLGVAFIAPVLLCIVSTIIIIFLGGLTGKRQGAWMKLIEHRINVTSQVLDGMKGIKISNLISVAQKRLLGLRDEELAAASRFRWLLLYTFATGSVPNLLAPLACLASFVDGGHGSGVTASRVFSSISLIALITQPLLMLFQAVPQFMSLFACLSRIEEFLATPSATRPKAALESVSTFSEKYSSSDGDEKAAESSTSETQDVSLESYTPCSLPLSIEGCSFEFESSAFTMKDINIQVQSGQFVGLIGPPGCGKSVICQAALGDVPPTRGHIRRSDLNVAYCSQSPWLINGTIRENIVINADFDQAWYDRVLECCALKDQVAQMANGDETLTGSNGVSLSGGQKQRLSIARAVYSRKSLIVMDGVLSGLDNSTQSHLLRSLLGSSGLLREHKIAVLLTTSHDVPLPFTDYVYVFNSTGSICDEGAFDEIQKRETYLETLKAAKTIDEPTNNESDPVISPSNDVVLSNEKAVIVGTNKPSTGEMATYKYYASIVGKFHVITLISLQALWAFLGRFSDVWLGWWSDANGARNSYYLGIYGLLNVLTLGILMLLAGHLFLSLQVKAGRGLHKKIVDTVVHASISFLSRTDNGHILNRFSQDLQIIDSDLPFAMMMTFGSTLTLLAQCILLIPATYWVAISYPFLIIVLFYLQRLYLKTAKRVRILDLEAKNPLYTRFSETLRGLATIRAFGWNEEMMESIFPLIDESQKPFYTLFSIQVWLNLVLGLIIAAITIVFVILVMELRSSMPAAFTGIALHNIAGLGSAMETTILLWTQMEVSMGAISRIKEFEETTPSEHLAGETSIPPQDWPKSGDFEVESLSAGYIEDKDTVKDISFHIKSGQKVALCGASGSGKSSLQLALLHLIELHAGKISLDGIDISTIPRNLLRSRINAIPQDGFLPQASVSYNLDPEEQYSLSRVQWALQRVGMLDLVQGKGGLDIEMNSETFSHGQRQLFCLARALLRGSKVILLDEAMSHLDQSTSTTIHQVIQEEFSECTVIAVIHRFHDVKDYDRVMVLDQGHLLEFDSPEILLARDSEFKRLYMLENSTNLDG